jgi:hypothetical protein
LAMFCMLQKNQSDFWKHIQLMLLPLWNIPCWLSIVFSKIFNVCKIENSSMLDIFKLQISVVFVKGFFSNYELYIFCWKTIMYFLPKSINMVCHINKFPDNEQILHSSSESAYDSRFF